MRLSSQAGQIPCGKSIAGVLSIKFPDIYFTSQPLCKYGRKCKIKNCPLKHEDEEEKSECLNYKQGFCYNGKSCRLRHVKRPPDECPALYDFNQSIAEGE